MTRDSTPAAKGMGMLPTVLFFVAQENENENESDVCEFECCSKGRLTMRVYKGGCNWIGEIDEWELEITREKRDTGKL